MASDENQKRAFINALRCDTLTGLLNEDPIFSTAIAVGLDYGVTAQEIADELGDPEVSRTDINRWVADTATPSPNVSRSDVMKALASIIERKLGA